MGAQQDRLGEVLRTIGFTETIRPQPANVATMPSEAQKHAMEVYRALGGSNPAPRLKTGSWDSAYEGDLVLELDESAHFNRYRAATLGPEWTQQIPWRTAYLEYSARFENACLKERGWGKYWTGDYPKNKTIASQFGPPGPPGELDGAGSPRWKQRALYDAVRDIVALHGGVRRVRLAVYDDLGGVSLGDALSGKAPLDADALRALVDDRTLG